MVNSYLRKYKNQGSFFFYYSSNKQECFKDCNAPNDKVGVYAIYGIKKGVEELVYIGRSGRLVGDNVTIVRKGGIKDRLINGKYKNVKQYKYWLERMLVDKYDRLKIYWYVTCNSHNMDSPQGVKESLINNYSPIWNNSAR